MGAQGGNQRWNKIFLLVEVLSGENEEHETESDDGVSKIDVSLVQKNRERYMRLNWQTVNTSSYLSDTQILLDALEAAEARADEAEKTLNKHGNALIQTKLERDHNKSRAELAEMQIEIDAKRDAVIKGKMARRIEALEQAIIGYCPACKHLTGSGLFPECQNPRESKDRRECWQFDEKRFAKEPPHDT